MLTLFLHGYELMGTEHESVPVTGNLRRTASVTGNIKRTARGKGGVGWGGVGVAQAS